MPVRIVSFSEIDTARQCPLKHELAYKQRWTNPDTSPALARGTAWHAVMEAHYGAIKAAKGHTDKEVLQSVADAVHEVLVPILRADEEQYDLLRWMYERYVECWGFDPQWKVVAIEHGAEVWLPTDRGTRSSFKLKMRMDLIVKWNGKLWVVDHKTCRNLPKEKELELDDQFGLYTWGMRQLGKPIFGTIYNACRTQRNKAAMDLSESFSRTALYRTDEELDAIAVEAWRTAKRAWGTPEGQAERNPNTDTCGWKCNFLEPCLASRKGMDRVDFLKAKGFVQDFTRH